MVIFVLTINKYLKLKHIPEKEITNKSYRQILKSTGVFGGLQIVTVLIGVLRNKILAVLLGASGIGLISIFQNILDAVRSLSSFGIETSGVREISAAKEEDLSEMIALIDRWVLIFSLSGAAICLLFCYPISLWVFADSKYWVDIALLSVCLFFTIQASGQIVILHGLRRIVDMVWAGIWSNIVGLLLVVPLYYFARYDAIIPAFIIIALVAYLVAYYYRSKIDLKTIKISNRILFSKGFSVVRIGFFIVMASVLTSLGYLCVRFFLKEELGLNAVGIFQGVWTIGNVYIVLILKSMGSDYYPRLSSIIENNKESNKLINEQLYIVLIVALPLVVLLLVSSKWILSLLYSSEFSSGYTVLNWFVLGSFFKVLSWPFGFILLAKSEGRLYFFSEMFFLLSYLLFVFVLYRLVDIDAVGIAYLVSYIFYFFTVWMLGRYLCQFQWYGHSISIVLISFGLMVSTFILSQYFRDYLLIGGSLFIIISLLYTLFKLNKVFSIKMFIHYLKNRF